MEILINDCFKKELVQASLVRITANATEETNALIDDNFIIITTSDEVSGIYTDYIGSRLAFSAYSNGYGASVGRIVHDKMIKRLIVLNFEIMDELDVIDAELDAVIAHELGHLLNRYSVPAQPKGMNDDDFNLENRKQNEFYADYFCKLTNTTRGLLTGIAKYMNSHYSNQETNDLFIARIAQINKNEVLIGKEAPKAY